MLGSQLGPSLESQRFQCEDADLGAVPRLCQSQQRQEGADKLAAAFSTGTTSAAATLCGKTSYSRSTLANSVLAGASFPNKCF